MADEPDGRPAWADATEVLLRARVAELEAEVKRLEERDREWWQAARMAMRGHELFPPDYTPEKYPDDHPDMQRDTADLYELYRGRGWTDQPACALEMVVGQRDRISARVAELEAENAALREALEPFAEYGRSLHLTHYQYDFETVLMEVTDAPNIDVGDCRRAASVLSSGASHAGDGGTTT